MREITVENYLRTRVINAGGDIEKHVSPGRRGVADELVTWPHNGTWLAEIHLIETKAPGGRLSPAQKRYIEAKRKMGVEVRVIWTKDQVDAYVQRYRPA